MLQNGHSITFLYINDLFILLTTNLLELFLHFLIDYFDKQSPAPFSLLLDLN